MFEPLMILALAAAPQVMPLPAPREVPSERLANYGSMDQPAVAGDVPNSARGIDVPGCAAVSFVVEKNGTTSHVRVRRVEPAGDFGPIAQSIAAGLRFDPTPFNAGRERVFSWLLFPFNLPADETARAAVMQRCVVHDLHLGDE
jgi:hypothetical protein